MSLQTKHTRQHDDDPLVDDVNDAIDKQFLPTLKGLDFSRKKKLVVVFSGGNAIGKSSIAKLLQEELSALVINNDDIKRAIVRGGLAKPGDDSPIHPMCWKYGLSLYRRIGKISPNGLIVRDAVIDWYFSRILPIFEKQGFEILVIGADLSDDFHVNLIKKRGGTELTTAERLISLRDDHKQHIANFRKHYDVDYMITDDNFGDWQPIVELIKQKLED